MILLCAGAAACHALLSEVGVKLESTAYVFSGHLLGATPWNPDWVTHKVAEVAASVGVSLNINALRHYTASQLLADGIDLRNTAARLGHGGGGATTLRHYADPCPRLTGGRRPIWPRSLGLWRAANDG